jgi:hypothetical protein
MPTGKLTRIHVETLLIRLDSIKEFTLTMRKDVREPTWREVCDADNAVDAARRLILDAALGDVEVEVMEPTQ